jgi:phytoene dehydrogenase-like protein
MSRQERFGDRMCAYHRVDLHSGLRELAEKAGVKIYLGKEISKVEPDEGIVEIRDGEKVAKDLWILADGCHVSALLPSIIPEEMLRALTEKRPGLFLTLQARIYLQLRLANLSIDGLHHSIKLWSIHRRDRFGGISRTAW